MTSKCTFCQITFTHSYILPNYDCSHHTFYRITFAHSIHSTELRLLTAYILPNYEAPSDSSENKRVTPATIHHISVYMADTLRIIPCAQRTLLKSLLLNFSFRNAKRSPLSSTHLAHCTGSTMHRHAQSKLRVTLRHATSRACRSIGYTHTHTHLSDENIRQENVPGTLFCILICL